MFSTAYLVFANMKFDLIQNARREPGAVAFDAMVENLKWYGVYEELAAEYDTYNDQICEFDL